MIEISEIKFLIDIRFHNLYCGSDFDLSKPHCSLYASFILIQIFFLYMDSNKMLRYENKPNFIKFQNVDEQLLSFIILLYGSLNKIDLTQWFVPLNQNV
ncbi:hypothetical protein BLOT_007806 [Blomia tropicalis]|nr:hypothetical protein BLOT_007806 [Blomia tropicalis]